MFSLWIGTFHICIRLIHGLSMVIHMYDLPHMYLFNLWTGHGNMCVHIRIHSLYGMESSHPPPPRKMELDSFMGPWGTLNFHLFFFFFGGGGGNSVFSTGGMGGVPPPLAKNLLIPPPKGKVPLVDSQVNFNLKLP